MAREAIWKATGTVSLGSCTKEGSQRLLGPLFIYIQSNSEWCNKHKTTELFRTKRTIRLRLTLNHDPIPATSDAFNFIHIQEGLRYI